MAKRDVYKEVTDAILAKLEEGVVPWHKPWKASGIQRNLQSKRPYRGINQFLLQFSGFSTPYWTTFNACKKAGGKVKKGEKSTLVVFWKIIRNEVENADGEKEIKTIPMLKFYHVFNLEQCEDLKIPKETEQNPDFNAIETCEDLVQWEDEPEFAHGGHRAFYFPAKDKVTLPTPQSFESDETYYATLFHEYVHATGHTSRLKREGVTRLEPGQTSDDVDAYSKEELVAEMGAAFLCGLSGISPLTVDNSASYIANWQSKLKDPDNKKILVQAAAQAQKAADYIQNIKHETDTNGHTAKEAVAA